MKDVLFCVLFYCVYVNARIGCKYLYLGRCAYTFFDYTLHEMLCVFLFYSYLVLWLLWWAECPHAHDHDYLSTMLDLARHISYSVFLISASVAYIE